MQTLEDVLLLAMKGEDPFKIDALLRKRGDYRPHAAFGVDLAVCVWSVVLHSYSVFRRVFDAPISHQVPWTAGTQEEPSWEVAGAAHATTRALPSAGDAGGGALTLALRELCVDDEQSIAPDRRAGASAERPWERVGAAGWQVRAHDDALVLNDYHALTRLPSAG